MPKGYLTERSANCMDILVELGTMTGFSVLGSTGPSYCVPLRNMIAFTCPLGNYFPVDVKNKKIVEFMKLEQGNMSVAVYAAKFQSLYAFSPHYNTVEAENDKCIKFESGLRPDIKHLIGFSEIRKFASLVAKSRICDEDGKSKSSYFKAASEKRGKGQDRGKPYVDNGKKVVESSGTRKKGSGKCYKCGEMGKEGHKSLACKKPKKTTGKVFALSGNNADQVDNLIREIPASGSVTTRLVCRDCPVTIFDRHFGMDLVCIQLSGIDVIFGINWLIFNRVHINCCEKTIIFPKPEENFQLMSEKKVIESLKEPVEMFALFASLKLEKIVKMEELQLFVNFLTYFRKMC
ncbi:hypothetical protein TSUD_141380 [Trifolium subterraneum]|uniref:Retrotransposon gag domain-containing protein n=1 Tax=Trifolium subterraneum TaxID=3900 RepID=A0A2Z6N6E5_TRISU|nr:hypothetical protein TSUD_141380 [Trifolium subterraneum]